MFNWHWSGADHISRRTLALGFSILFVSSFAVLIHQSLYQPCCDALQYAELARLFNVDGIENIKNTVRTFGYPWLLSLLYEVSDLLNIPKKFLVFVFQTTIYFIAALLIAGRIARSSPKLGGILFLALCCNIFVYPYLSLSLTDSLYTSLSLLVLVYFFSSLQSDRSPNATARHLTLAVFITCAVIAIRPAGIWLLVPLLYFLITFCHKNRCFDQLLLPLVVGSSPLALQAFLNAEHFSKLTIFPTVELGGLQIKWGIENIKYATWLGEGEPKNFYPSGALVNLEDSDRSISWYFSNPLQAARLLAYKTFGAFDWDYYLPYPRENISNNYALSLASFSIVFWGVVGAVSHAVSKAHVEMGPRLLPILICFSWAAVTLASAVELRFTLPALSYLLFLAVITLFDLAGSRSKLQLLLLSSGFVLFLAFAIFVSSIVRNQAVV